MSEKGTLEWLAARGVIAAGVAAELSAPLDAVYDKLAATVERLDRHVATARGPEPLPYQTTSEIRERVADVFLQVGRVRRLAASLATLAAPPAQGPVDLNEVVERALNLARHRFAADSDALLDLATLPAIAVDGARLAQAVALLLVHAAETAAPSGTVVIRTEATAGEVRLRVHAPRDQPAGALPFGEVVRTAIEADGGRLVIEAEPAGFFVLVGLPRAGSLR